eukprot:scaffold28001_cov21-Tisochrysis_lutea.AAC.1
MAALSLVGVLADRAHHRVRTRWWAGKLKRHWALLERAAVSLNSWGAHIRGCSSKVRKLISLPVALGEVRPARSLAVSESKHISMRGAVAVRS